MSATLFTPPPSGMEQVPFSTLVDRALETLPKTLPPVGPELLVALDVDGTIVSRDGASKEVLSAIRDLIDSGTNVVIATGRGTQAAAEALGSVKIDTGWGVCSNGAVVVQWNPKFEIGRRVIKQYTFDPGHILDRLQEHHPEALLAVEDVEAGVRGSGPFPVGEFLDSEAMEVVSRHDLYKKPIVKMVVRIPHMDREEFVAAMTKIDFSGTECAIGWTSWMDIGPAGVTKVTGLKHLSEKLGLAASGTIAMGDGTNDMSMLKWAAHGVAMGNAEAEVKAAANTVTGTVEDDGAAAVMRALLER